MSENSNRNLARSTVHEIDEDEIMDTITTAISETELEIKVDTTTIKGYTDEVEAKVDAAQSAIQVDIVSHGTALATHEANLVATQSAVQSDISAHEAHLDSAELRLRDRKYEKVLYVSKNGDNSDGLSWDTAFTTFEAANDATISTGLNMINVGVGTFEVAPAGNFVQIDNKVHVRGAGPESTIFMSLTGDSGSDYVFKCMTASRFEDFSFHGHGYRSYGMIYFYGAHGSSVENVIVYDYNENYNDCYMFNIIYSQRCKFKDIKIRGGTTKIQAIAVNNSKECKFEDIDIWESGRGIWVSGSSSQRNEFLNIRTYGCASGVQMMAGDENHFEGCKIVGSTEYGFNIAAGVSNTRITNTKFAHNNININDASISTALTEIVSNVKNAIYPESLTGVVLPNSGVLDVWGTNTVIIPTATINKPFKILAYTAAPSDDKKFIIRLSSDSGVSYFMHMMDRRDGLNGELGRVIIGFDTTFQKGTEISGSILAEVIDENVEVWLYIQEI